MRGKGDEFAFGPPCSGITPAHAGKSPMRTAIFLPCEGSPPRMRGKVVRPFLLISYIRITPAHAGKSGSGGVRRLYSGDHPRACGEKFCPAATVAIAEGSPPRMRGKELEGENRESHKRITPAHAGKSENSRLKWPKSKDHPRACGEKACATDFISRRSGSPPRMRGKALASFDAYTVTGITPAHAGKSSVRVNPALPHQDHPRACGEK